MSNRRKRRKSKKNLAYGIVIVAFILICIVIYSYLNQPNSPPSPPDQLPSEAAIVDHLSFREETKNETFKNSSIIMLETAGFNVTYYPGKSVTVDFYKNLFSHNYALIVLRVHSAMIGDSEDLGLFTSEVLNPSKYNASGTSYYDDVVNNRIVKAYFPEDAATEYFAVAPGFVEKYGNFQNTTIIIMGCDGLKHNPMAEAFRREGAKVCIGWNGLVSTLHTDCATTRLLQHLTQGDTTEEAVAKTMDEVGPEGMYFQTQGYNSTLECYPRSAGNYTIQTVFNFSRMDTVEANTVIVKKEIKETRPNWL
jgi:hypothetical protein